MSLKLCHQYRTEWEQYEVGGKFYNQYKEITRSGEIAKWKKKYADDGCGKDPALEKCLNREWYIQNLQNQIFIENQQNNDRGSGWGEVLAEETKKFNDLGCNAKIQQSRNVVVEEKLDKYTTLDKQRIEAESKYQANKKIFIGVSVILVAVALVVVIKSE
jgi:hypothetical protein